MTLLAEPQVVLLGLTESKSTFLEIRHILDLTPTYTSLLSIQKHTTHLISEVSRNP